MNEAQATRPALQLGTVLFLAAAMFLTAWLLTDGTKDAGAGTSSFFPNEYLCCTDPKMAFGDRSSPLNSSAAETSLHTGDDGWDNVSGNWLDWGWAGEDNSVSWNGGCGTSPTNKRHYLTSDGIANYAARTGRCVGTSSGNLLRGATRFDDDGSTTWYTGSGTPGPGQTDLRGMVVHEMGHAAGWVGHLSSPCGYVSYQATMCSGTYFETTWWRSLQSWDRNEIAAAY